MTAQPHAAAPTTPAVVRGVPAAAEALAPVRAALLSAADERAAALRGAARAEAAAMLAAARRQADEILSRARASGESDGRTAAAAHRARSRRAARSVLLRAQRAAYDELCLLAQEAVCGLHDDPAYPRLAARLSELARGLAGAAAVLSEHPSGGVTAQAPGRYVDCSLPRLAEAAVEALGPEVSELWSK